MNNKNEILNELKTLAPTLAGLTKQNCYTIPNGYFLENMPKVSTVSNILDIETSQAKGNLIYLDLMSEILADNFADIAKIEVFKVPNNYFEDLTEDVIAYKNSILAIENLESSVTLDEAFQINKYAVPQNYFDNLSQNILNKINLESKAEVSKELAAHLNETVFTVPQNYFNNLSQNIFKKINTPAKSAKIISLQKVRNVLAIAATLALFVAGAWLLNSTGSNKVLSFDEQIHQLSANDIEAYITSNAYEFENELLTEDLIEEDSDDLFWQIDLNAGELDYYLQNINEYNLNI